MLLRHHGGDATLISRQQTLHLVRADVMTFSLHSIELQRILVGSAMMGIAVPLMTVATGYPLGIAGLCREAVAPSTTERGIRVMFLGGALASGLFLRLYNPIYVLDGNERHPVALIFGAAISAYGCVLANGCTSGHGMSGLSRFSTRSVIFVTVFMALLSFPTFFLVRCKHCCREI